MATQALSTDRFPTASAVLPLKYVLLSHLMRSTGNPAEINEMKTKISTDLEKQYSPDKDALMLLNTASYLDPRFHRLINLERSQQQAVRKKVKEELTVIEEEEGYEEDEEGAAMAMGTWGQEKHQCYGRPFWECFLPRRKRIGLYFANWRCPTTRNADVKSETPLPTDSNPLSWWKTSGSKYSHIAQLARHHLSILGTAFRAERIFSMAGIIINKKRSALDSENVDCLVFWPTIFWTKSS